MTKIVIADDEKILLESLGQRIERFWPEASIVAQCRDGQSALAAINHYRPTVAFLDVKMGCLSGIDIPRMIEFPCKIVYVTAYDQYAITAFEQGVVDYLLKPISDQRLQQCIERIKANSPSLIQQQNPSGEYLTSLSLRVGHKVWVQPVSEISFIRACGRYVEINVQQKHALIRTPLSVLFKQLDPNLFLQIHRSIVVNIEQIEYVDINHQKPHVHLKHIQEPLPVGRNFRTQLKKYLSDFE